MYLNIIKISAQRLLILLLLMFNVIQTIRFKIFSNSIEMRYSGGVFESVQSTHVT